jgi:hypothetical protein
MMRHPSHAPVGPRDHYLGPIEGGHAQLGHIKAHTFCKFAQFLPSTNQTRCCDLLAAIAQV